MKIAVTLLLSLVVPLPFMGLATHSYGYSFESNNSVNKQTIVVQGSMPDIVKDDIVLRLDPAYPVDDPHTMSSDFGYRLLSNCNSCSRNHQGVDFPLSNRNNNIYAIMDGEITRLEHKGGFGLHIYIDHVIHPGELEYRSIYAHMKPSDVTNSLSVGDEVVKGQHIGYIGNTGMSTGPHLHLEVHRNDEVLDPEQFYDYHLK